MNHIDKINQKLIDVIILWQTAEPTAKKAIMKIQSPDGSIFKITVEKQS